MKTQEELYALIRELARIRKVPQILFTDGIWYTSVIELREKIIKFKSDNPHVEEIDFILYSAGGIPSDAYRIIRTLRNGFKTVNIVIPFWAKSAATLIALGGSKLIVDEFGELGPLDVQLAKEMDDRPDYERESALIDEASLKRIETHSIEMYYTLFCGIYKNEDVPIHKTEISKQIFDFLASFYTPLMNQINPYRLGEKKRKLDIGEKYAERILLTYQPQLSRDKRTMLVNFLVNECPEHGYVIDYSLIRGFLGDIVIKSDEINSEYQSLMSDLSIYFLEYDDSLDSKIIIFNFEEESTLENNETNSLKIKTDNIATVNSEESVSTSTRQKEDILKKITQN